ncbi:hypothetical protein ACGFJ5_23315 [Micromonospora echinaurantiaca]|uniref:hypothetical protein n=1 Tax=Micromonospora echinaurantiaca TaxID=47857 RepID=UPI00370F7FE1
MTGYDEREVRDLLLHAADELPAATVLPEPLLTEGRRAVRRRRLVAGAAAVVTVLALLGATALLDATRPTPPPAPPANRPPAEVPERFDPAQWLFRLQDIPGDLPVRSYYSDRRIQRIGMQPSRVAADAASTAAGEQSRSVSVEIGARGVDLFKALRADGRGLAELPGAQVAPVAGAPAYLHTERDGRTTRLSWQYAPDAWAVITLDNVERPEEVGRRVAAGIIWQQHRVTMPIRAIAPPADVQLDRTFVRVEHNRWSDVYLGYVLSSAIEPPKDPEDITISVSRELTRQGRGSTTVAGRSAWEIGSPDGRGFYGVGQMPGSCPTCSAQVRCLTVAGIAALGGRDGAFALAAAVRLVDDPDDMATWQPV